MRRSCRLVAVICVLCAFIAQPVPLLQVTAAPDDDSAIPVGWGELVDAWLLQDGGFATLALQRDDEHWNLQLVYSYGDTQPVVVKGPGGPYYYNPPDKIVVIGQGRRIMAVTQCPDGTEFRLFVRIWELPVSIESSRYTIFIPAVTS